MEVYIIKMVKKSFLNNLAVGIISILIGGLFGGLWYNESYKREVLSNHLDNPFFGQFNRNAHSDHVFYANIYISLCVILVVFGAYVMVKAAKRKNNR